MEALGTLVAKALTRLHRAPSIAVLILVTTSPEAIVANFSAVPAKSVPSIPRFSGAAAEIETIGTVLPLRVFKPFVSVAGSIVAR
jgi:hypothetical protein